MSIHSNCLHVRPALVSCAKRPRRHRAGLGAQIMFPFALKWPGCLTRENDVSEEPNRLWRNQFRARTKHERLLHIIRSCITCAYNQSRKNVIWVTQAFGAIGLMVSAATPPLSTRLSRMQMRLKVETSNGFARNHLCRALRKSK